MAPGDGGEDFELSLLQGRWLHSLDKLGLLTVCGDVVFFDRGSALRLQRGPDGLPRADGWVYCRSLSNKERVIWVRSPDCSNAWGAEGWRDPDELTLQAADRALQYKDAKARSERLTRLGMYTWERPLPAQWFYQDRFCTVQESHIPERTSIFVVPPPASMPEGTKPWRILAYGGCLTIGWPGGDPYARGFVDALGEAGIYAEVVGCGIANQPSSALSAQAWSADIRDKFGLRGEGIAHMAKHRGPFDFALIMAGTPDVVKGGSGASVVQLHEACHALGLHTVALGVPPSWHDDPSALTKAELDHVTRFNEFLRFVKPEVIARKKLALNLSLQEFTRSPAERTLVTGGVPCGSCVLFVDCCKLIPCGSRWRGLWEQQDWLHLTSSGSQHLGRGVARCMLPHLRPAAVVQRLEPQRARPQEGAGAGPRVYEVVHGTLLRKGDPRCTEGPAGKVAMSKRPVGSLVRTTGVLWTGGKGTSWVELDPARERKGGWLAVQGHCFGIGPELLRPRGRRPTAPAEAAPMAPPSGEQTPAAEGQ